MEDLWPDDIKIAGKKIKPPVGILKQQAALLGKKTDNIVTAEVTSYQLISHAAPTPRQFNYRFYIEAPALGYYRFALFSISHNIELYPVYVEVDKSIIEEVSEKEEIIANSEEEFTGILKKIFNSDKTKRIIGAILSQSSEV